ncbi:MAG: type I-A CRISPR-associated protein Cas5a [Thermodesulfobacteriota bacterium]
MFGVKVEGRFHWGFWVRVPNTSKVQPSLPIPPPTTLVGALAYPLFREAQELGEVRDVRENKKRMGVRSSAYLLNEAVVGCAIYLANTAFSLEDSSKHNTLLFYRKSAGTAEEKEVGGRRYLPKYRSGTIRTGKIIYPNGKAVIAYLLDLEKLSSVLEGKLKERVERAAWQISRVGSKESIFSVEKVEVFDDVPQLTGTVETKFYFPTTAAKVKEEIETQYYYENFWKGGWGNLDDVEFVQYVVPGKKAPIESISIEAYEMKRAYKFGEEEVLIVA